MDSDGIEFLRYVTVPVTFAVMKTAAGELRLGKSRMELRMNSMIQHGQECPDTQRALADWPEGRDTDVE
jgi:hypothetical protein